MAIRKRPRRRIGTTVDVGKLSRAVQRPGIDPRLVGGIRAIVSSDVQVDDSGYYVDVKLLPGLEDETARLGCLYAGVGFGAYLPLEVDDEVLCIAPYGTPNAGLVVVARLHSKSDPPPSEVKDHAADALLLLKSGANLRLAVQGAGNAVIRVDSGKVLLGAETGTLPNARKTDPIEAGAFSMTGGTVVGPPPVTTITLLWTPTGGAPTTVGVLVFTSGLLTAFTPGSAAITGKITDGSRKVESA